MIGVHCERVQVLEMCATRRQINNMGCIQCNHNAQT